MLTRHGVAAATAAAVIVTATGCTATTGGRVIAAPTLGHAPPPLAASALPGLLLDAGAISSILGGRVHVVDSSDAMYTNAADPDGCLVWAEAQQLNYQGSGFTGVAMEKLEDRRDNPDHIAYQAVVAFPDGLGAQEYYAGQVTRWAQCDQRRVDLHDAGDTPHYWSLSKSVDNAGVLSIMRAEEENPGWSCQHALTTKLNIVIDVNACTYGVGDRGIQLAKKVAEQVAT